MNVKIVFFIVGLLAYIMLSIIIFVFLSRLIKRKNMKMIIKARKEINPLIDKQIENIKLNNKIDNDAIIKINDRINNPIYLDVFNDKIIELRSKKEDKEAVNAFLDNFRKRFIQEFKMLDKDDYLKYAHSIFVYGEYRYHDIRIVDRLIEGLNSESNYVKINSIRALAKIGDKDKFINSLKIISDRNIYINDKILIDSMDIFEGDKKDFNEELGKNIDSFSERIKILVINHFTNNKFEEVNKQLFNKLKSNDESTEVKLAIIKYFGRIKYAYMEIELINLLNNERWEIRALAAKIAVNYSSKVIKEGLLKTLCDSNWFVRYNSAMSIINFDNNTLLIEKAMKLDDKYARDIMLYSLFNKKLITYNEYINLTVKENNSLVEGGFK
ncbi:hypothetical protein [Clostridium sp. D46t1_190503_E9]|uniref:HEAT repeat domain-containing protein n=1 Tax=Clostridium sp. D46t1_190503_E9 TaxID=2787137 RepID=UPI00189AAFBF|nr:hypothetical protein [Clostridium sp. D46t1_190503_E9]